MLYCHCWSLSVFVIELAAPYITKPNQPSNAIAHLSSNRKPHCPFRQMSTALKISPDVIYVKVVSLL